MEWYSSPLLMEWSVSARSMRLLSHLWVKRRLIVTTVRSDIDTDKVKVHDLETMRNTSKIVWIHPILILSLGKALLWWFTNEARWNHVARGVSNTEKVLKKTLVVLDGRQSITSLLPRTFSHPHSTRRAERINVAVCLSIRLRHPRLDTWECTRTFRGIALVRYSHNNDERTFSIISCYLTNEVNIST